MATHPNEKLQRKAAVVAAIRRLAVQLGQPPTQHQYKREVSTDTAPTLSQALYLFGTWSKAISAAGFRPNENKPPRINDLSEGQLVREFVAVANRLRKMPTQAEFNQHSGYSIRPYTRRWGNWSGVRKYFTDNYRESFDFAPIEATARTQSGSNALRSPLSLDCPLCFVPQNEMETIVLFGLMAAKLGYRIRSIRADFPDGELEQNGTIILAEFEYESANYLQHGHPLDFDGICVCWRRTRDLNRGARFCDIC